MEMKVMLDDGAYAPESAHFSDAGFDLRSMKDAVIQPGCSETFDTGVHVEIPRGCFGLICNKSGLNFNHDIVSEIGVIDEGYTGSIAVKLVNNGIYAYHVHRGNKITQLVILPVLHPEVSIVKELKSTDRGSNGFGSTGV